MNGKDKKALYGLLEKYHLQYEQAGEDLGNLRRDPIYRRLSDPEKAEDRQELMEHRHYLHGAENALREAFQLLVPDTII